jgi:general secretion pathway protein E
MSFEPNYGVVSPRPLDGAPISATSVDDFADLLIRSGLIEASALDRARKAAEATAERLDLALVKLGLVSEDNLAGGYARYFDLPLIQPNNWPTEPILRDRLKFPFLKTNRILPLAFDRNILRLAVTDPFNDEPARAVGYLLDAEIERLIVTPAEFDRMLRALYRRARDEPDDDEVHVVTVSNADGADLDVQRLRDIANEAPVVRLVNQIIANAVEQAASDIHIEPRPDAIAVRCRIDGFLQQARQIQPALRAALVTRIKIMAKLDIAERRLPQDGRIKTAVRGVEIDIRVSTLPTAFGEGIVMRILDRTRVELDLAKLGLGATTQTRLRGLLSLPNGIILVTGPTGSGKTTTLYAALEALNRPDLKLFSVEDPIEYQLSGVSQIQVQPQIGLTFPTALRSILRQDPDIIMIGEIRDLETAKIAVQAALTGHLVFSTLHTNSALGAATRLTDLGLEPYLLSSTIAAVMAQRLVRRLCPKCARRHSDPTPIIKQLFAELPADFPLDETSLKEGVGCESCSGTGYRGRTTISELVIIDEAMRDAITKGRDERAMEQIARSEGYSSLYVDGLSKVAIGETTLQEILRVTRAS